MRYTAAGLGGAVVAGGVSGAITYADYHRGHDPEREPRTVQPRSLLYAELANPAGWGSRHGRPEDNWASQLVPGAIIGGLVLTGAAALSPRIPTMLAPIGLGVVAGGIVGAIVGRQLHTSDHPAWVKADDERPTTLGAVRDNLLDELDRDGDGRIATRRRSQPGADSLLASGYTKGVLFIEERSNIELAEERMDIDRDGWVSADEIDTRLAEADRNDDGLLSHRDAKRFARDNFLWTGRDQRP